MVGGGNNAFIGAVHRAAALMDNRIELVCGCFSSHPDISLASGREYFLPDNRIYFSHAEMIEKESALPDGSVWISYLSSRPTSPTSSRR